MNIENKKILVVGLGVSGMAVALFLKKRGADVTGTDMAAEDTLGSSIQKAKDMGIQLELGGHHAESFERTDLIVLSPGVPHTIEPIVKAKKKGIPVIGEIELASRFISEPIIAITGTNGKTTTTNLLGDILTESGIKTFVGGNIGKPLISYADQDEKAAVVVAEISSFQLDTIDSFRPAIGILLNISPDHLDRYPDIQSYAESKFRIFMNQKKEDTAIINSSDPMISAMGKRIKSSVLSFNTDTASENGAFINNEYIYLKTAGHDKAVLDIADIRLEGKHNFENIAAASLAGLSAGCTVDSIKTVLKRFKGLSHRLEYVDTINGVVFYDDSKATNVDAVLRALETFTTPVVLIMGGRDKRGGYDILSGIIQKRAKQLIVIGEAADNIKADIGHIVATERASSMEEAVKKAYRHAVSGDVVLLSPACSSFDMFDSYAHRGDVFCRAVKQLG